MRQRKKKFYRGAIFFSFLIVLSIGVRPVVHSQEKVENKKSSPDEITIDVRSMRLKKFPCSQCHELIPELKGGASGAHPDIVMKHGEINKNCLVCHDSNNMNKLQVFEPPQSVSFEESYKVCGQCHGDIMKYWNTGIHGLQTGYWNGKKLRRTCTACHNPHDPEIKTFKPYPPPNLPKGAKRVH